MGYRESMSLGVLLLAMIFLFSRSLLSYLQALYTVEMTAFQSELEV
jgi:hypothetical protein